MIEDARLLVDDFLSNDTVHRHTDMNHLATVLQPLFDDNTSRNTLIDGSSDAGNTCLATAWSNSRNRPSTSTHTTSTAGSTATASDHYTKSSGMSRKAHSENEAHTTESHIRFAIRDATDRKRQKTLERISQYQRVIYNVLAFGDDQPRHIYHAYQQRVNDVRPERMIRKYYQKILQYYFVEREWPGRTRQYSMTGPIQSTATGREVIER
jgi:Cdc6-like AAA superfamily ATPase